jgi:hypothetical protein
VFLTKATDSNLVDDLSPHCPRVIPYTLALRASVAVCFERGGCIESGDDLVPVLRSAFGRVDWVGGDGCLTGFLSFFHCRLGLMLGCEEEWWLVESAVYTFVYGCVDLVEV